MKTKQVGLVLIALLAIGVAGLVLRVASTSPREVKLAGVQPISESTIDKVTLKLSGTPEIELRKVDGKWLVNDKNTSEFKIKQLLAISSQIAGAPLIAREVRFHERMAVDALQGIVVTFWRGDAVYERFIVSSKWGQDARMCYLRRPDSSDVYGVPCPAPLVFDTSVNPWRDPSVVQIPQAVVESVEMTYLNNEKFELRREALGWRLYSGNEVEIADPSKVGQLLNAMENLQASDFEGDQTAGLIDFSLPNGVITVRTKPDSTAAGTTLQLLDSGGGFYRIRREGDTTIFIVDSEVVEAFFLPKEKYIFGSFLSGGGGGAGSP